MREKAATAGADIRECSFVSHEAQPDGTLRVKLRYRDGREEYQNFDYVVGADGAGSQVAKSCGRVPVKHALAIQERLMLPTTPWNITRTPPNSISATTSRPTFTAGCFPRAIASRSELAASPNMRTARTHFSKA